MNKKALIGKIILIAVIVLAITSVTYFSFSKNNFIFSTKNVVVDIKYSPNETQNNIEEPEEIIIESNQIIPNKTPLNITNITSQETNLTIENISEQQ